MFALPTGIDLLRRLALPPLYHQLPTVLCSLSTQFLIDLSQQLPGPQILFCVDKNRESVSHESTRSRRLLDTACAMGSGKCLVGQGYGSGMPSGDLSPLSPSMLTAVGRCRQEGVVSMS